MTAAFQKILTIIILVSFVLSACASSTWEENQKAIIGVWEVQLPAV
jgi:hypothetical protein